MPTDRFPTVDRERVRRTVAESIPTASLTTIDRVPVPRTLGRWLAGPLHAPLTSHPDRLAAVGLAPSPLVAAVYVERDPHSADPSATRLAFQLIHATRGTVFRGPTALQRLHPGAPGVAARAELRGVFGCAHRVSTTEVEALFTFAVSLRFPRAAGNFVSLGLARVTDGGSAESSRVQRLDASHHPLTPVRPGVVSLPTRTGPRVFMLHAENTPTGPDVVVCEVDMARQPFASETRVRQRVPSQLYGLGQQRTPDGLYGVIAAACDPDRQEFAAFFVTGNYLAYVQFFDSGGLPITEPILLEDGVTDGTPHGVPELVFNRRTGRYLAAVAHNVFEFRRRGSGIVCVGPNDRERSCEVPSHETPAQIVLDPFRSGSDAMILSRLDDAFTQLGGVWTIGAVSLAPWEFRLGAPRVSALGGTPGGAYTMVRSSPGGRVAVESPLAAEWRSRTPGAFHALAALPQLRRTFGFITMEPDSTATVDAGRVLFVVEIEDGDLGPV